MAARRPQKPKTSSSSKALEQLVSQFAQPLAFLRELVQNSLDASTELIEVEVDWDEDAHGCYVSVKDTGIGMDRNTIDTKLTRLFASSKEDDFTKIGKFGIGFVSIFAIHPKVVVLETGRDGESWRLLFHPDRSFERRELAEPVEGTRVSVFTSKKKGELAQLQKECRDTIAFWCRHSEVEILFNGKAINEPFELPDALVQVRRKVEGTEAVVTPSAKPSGFQGYYNRGLTLLEGDGSPVPHVSFKLRSRYLEHTLSRDNIIYDQHYEKAIAEVRIAAYHDLPQELVRRLASSDDPALWRLARAVAKYPEPALSTLREAAILPAGSQRVAIASLPREVFFHPKLDALWLAAQSHGLVVLQAEENDDSLGLLSDLGVVIIKLSEAFLHFEVLSAGGDSETALVQQLVTHDKELKRLVLVRGLHVPVEWQGQLCGYLDKSKGLARTFPDSSANGPDIAVFRSHPLWSKLVRLYESQPELGISLASRKLSLELGLSTDGDASLFGYLIKSLRARTGAARS